ncbi:MAG: MoxR family ATPase [Halanaerobiales bacterium]|nr:MoxR family ATPase [Halanaerobiales bacterium]
MKNASLDKIRENIQKVIIGKEKVIDLLMTALLAEGHVLLDDVPGLGKTVMAKTISKSLDCSFNRIQFTPDLQPADITGMNYYNQKSGEFVFKAGPIMSNIVLADEINRAIPRTQSSLLEAMEERQVTVDGVTYHLSEPFMVIATQNPVELAGTFPLPEAQLDRFLLRIEMGYPKLDEEVEILRRFKLNNPLNDLKPVMNSTEIYNLRQQVKNIFVEDELLVYIGKLVQATRDHKSVRLGVSPRGALALLKASSAYALILEREYVLPDDIKYIFPFVAKHRMILTDEADLRGIQKNEILEEILQEIQVPVEEVSVHV